MINQQGSKAGAGVLMIGLLVEDLAENVFGTGRISFDQRTPRLVDHQVKLAREHGNEEFCDCLLGERSAEAVDLFAVLDRDDRRDRLDEVLRRQFRIRIDIDLGEFKGTGCLLRHALKERRKGLAWLTPLSPEVNEDGHIARSHKYFLLEVCERDVLHKGAGLLHRGKVSRCLRGNLRGMDRRPIAPFGRLLTAIITPFDAEGSIDYAAFWRLVRHLRDNASEGIVVAGTTGEAPTLSKPEKIALFRAGVDAAKGKMRVVAGVGTYDTRESVALAEAAAEAGVDGLLVVTPYYSKPPQRGIVAHMTAIADATELPLMLYNIPGRSATIIEIDTLVELARHPRIVAVKDAVDDIDWSVRQINALPDGFAVYSGSDVMTKDLVAANGVGVVSVTAHLAGREIAAMIDAVVDNDWDTANELHDLIAPLTSALFAEPSPMPLKGGLTEFWDEVGEPRLPLVPAERSTVESIGKALEPIIEYRQR